MTPQQLVKPDRTDGRTNDDDSSGSGSSDGSRCSSCDERLVNVQGLLDCPTCSSPNRR